MSPLIPNQPHMGVVLLTNAINELAASSVGCAVGPSPTGHTPWVIETVDSGVGPRLTTGSRHMNSRTLQRLVPHTFSTTPWSLENE
jgi:hypothetical protein